MSTAMTGTGPNILVVDGDCNERVQIATLLREAGFGVVTAAEPNAAGAMLGRERFAAVVVAVAGQHGADFLAAARRRQPGLRALIAVDLCDLAREEDGPECATILRRPLDLRQLLGCVFELVLREEVRAAAPRHGHAAELGIAAAKIACLSRRHAVAAAAGASRLAQELARQIGEAQALRCGLAAASRGEPFAPQAAG